MNAKRYAVGMPLNAVSATLEPQQTRAPEHYTEDSLMDDMMSAYKFAKTDQDRDLLKSLAGIGTSRTRGVIIKSFVDRGFLVRTKKAKLYQLRVSPEARQLLQGLPDAIKDVALTAKWERALELVGTGVALPEQLKAKVNSMLRDMIGTLLPEKPALQAKVVKF